jgi:hypothetical protein
MFIREALMKKLFSIFLMFIVTSGLCWAEGYEVKGKAGSYAVVVTFDKSRPVLGTNRMKITITDAESRAVTDAQVRVESFMPSPGRKSSMMSYSTTAKPEGDKYEATIDLRMKGRWEVTISIKKDIRMNMMTFGFMTE